ncbi:hypothetical protein BDR26DRAFT_160068 [Obelidium mucronatum]|nr:hypothetical protein BDR26DRAFT_160068 [Obelidium mucronatum]
MFNLFKKDANSRPEGEIATTIIGKGLQGQCSHATGCVWLRALIDICTNPAAPEVDYPAVFTTIELIKGYYQTGTPLEGCVQAIKAIRYRLEAADPVTLNYTLTVLDTFYKNCEKPFVSQMSSKDNLKALETFLARRDLAPENRGQCLEMIANWARATEDPPEIRAFFETLLQSGYRFSAASLARLPPGAYERIMRGKPTTGFMGSRSHSQGVQPVQTAPVPPLPSKDVNAPFNYKANHTCKHGSSSSHNSNLDAKVLKSLKFLCKTVKNGLLLTFQLPSHAQPCFSKPLQLRTKTMTAMIFPRMKLHEKVSFDVATFNAESLPLSLK